MMIDKVNNIELKDFALEIKCYSLTIFSGFDIC